MSSIQKMAIQGIRSFGPEDKDKQVITFFTPLTLILGPNGTGKTTIIECLKYITTGDMPPGCKGGAFLHDPKIANENAVKGQVRLQFQDMSGKQCLVERSVLVTQKVKNLNVKTLDGVITRLGADGQKVSTTSRCVELNMEMVTSLGVSKAVLENVIFCHQEDSNWPLCEGKALKDKFDAIFASTRYVKALEAIRKLKQNQDGVLKEYRAEMKYLRQNKEKAAQITADLAETEAKFAASKESLRKYEEQIHPIEDKLGKIYAASRDIHKLNSQKGKIQGEKDMLQKTIDEILDKLENEFQGSTRELKQILSEFQSKVEETEATVVEFEKKSSRIKRELDRVNEDRSKIDVDVGKMEQAANDHEDNVRRRDASVRQLATEYKFEGFSSGEITSQRYSDFEEKVKERMTKLSDQYIQVKEKYEEEEKEIQGKINKVREKVTKVEHDIHTKKETTKKNQCEIKDLNKKLSEVDASAGKLEETKRDLRKTERDLEMVEGSVNTDLLKAEITQLQREKQTLDASVSALSSEMNRLHMESSLVTEVNMLKKERTSKEDGVRKVKAKHEDTLKYLLGEMPGQNVRGLLDEYIGSQTADVKTMERELQRNKMELSTKEANRKNLKEQLKKKEDELKGLEEKVSEVCGDENVEVALKSLQKKMGQAQDQRGSLLGAQHFFKKYVEELEKEEPCCPLCHREFDGDQEVRELVLELQQKLRMVPSKVESAERELKDHQRKYDSMLQLRPLQDNISILEETDVPEMRTRLTKLTTEVETLRQTIIEKEEDLQSKQGDLAMATTMTADIILMDRYLGEIRDLDRKISAKSAKLSGGDSTRTMQQVNDEQEEAKLQLDTVTRKLDHKREKVSNHSEQVQELKGQVNALTADKLRIENEVQQRCKLEERKTLLQTENDALALNIEDQADELGPLQRQVKQLEAEKVKVAEEKSSEVDAIKSDGDKTQMKMSEVHAVNKQIKSYLRERKDQALQKRREDQAENVIQVERLTTDQQEARASLDRLRTELANQQVRERELQDNLQLREKQQDMERLQREIDKLLEDIGGLDPIGLDEQRRKLEDEKDEIKNRKSQVEGRQRGYFDEVKRLKADLRSDQYDGAADKCRDKAIALRTTELANGDLEKYYKALDRAIMSYHSMKMAEINKIIRELWRNTYRGNDIETIEIRSDEDDSGAMKSRRVYNYRVVMVKGNTDLDMRGRCSAGQKVLASLIIRLALAETFCLNCGILALDEPTTNLDRENIESLAYALVEIIKSRSVQRNFQLIVITHDEDFVELLGRSDYVEDFYRIRKNAFGCSQINSAKVIDLHTPAR